MESAHLTKAHEHALRILSLLEDHHRKLAGLIKEAPPRTDKKSSSTSRLSESTSTTPAARTSSPSASAPRTHRRLPQPSIASNLAEKRGIPSARRTTGGTAVTASGANAARDGQATPVRDLLERQARKADQSRSRELTKPSEAPQPSSPPPEDNFRRFYSAFGGVISAISAPLAFTSLPLNPAPPTPATEPPKTEKASRVTSRNPSPEASRTVKSSVPDLAALISKPALRALRSDGGTTLNPNESFYLVPTSGGTVTYASMLQGPGTQPHHLNPIEEGSGSLKGSHDEFVDAQESVEPPSPTSSRRPRSRSAAGQVTSQPSIPAGRGTGLKTLEELALENETLKSLVDKQAKRIQMWETNSQNQFNALAQSFRTRPPARLSSDPSALAHALSSVQTPCQPSSSSLPGHQGPQSPGATDAATAKRIADLEAQLAAQFHRMEHLSSTNAQLARQNEKDKQVIGRYREQWEKLKAGARKKEHERRERRLHTLKAGDAKDSESGDAVGEVEEEGESEADFGRA
ncbi:hypothetical protein N0V86_009233 [Didymella sp. IMI 355093]|nr:hypothetical protein N0V86_009233 [Didymella sp. IMI 355093]